MNLNVHTYPQLTGDWESIRRSVNCSPIANTHRAWHEVYWKDGYKLTEAQQQEMYNEVYKPIDDWEDDIQRSNKRLFKAIKKVKGRKFCSALSRWLYHLKEECFHKEQMKCELVRKPSGNKQKAEPCYGKHITHEWCDQRVGYCGDDYYGDMYIQIDDKRYMKVNYSM